MKNHRAEKRVMAKGSVSYTSTSDDSGKMHAGLLSNLSKHGACIYTQEPITTDKMTVFINGTMDAPLDAEVLWCRETIDNLYKIGLKFQK